MQERQKKALELNKRFFTFHQKKRPYVILKWAESQDGFIAPLTKDKKEPVWISNEFSRQMVPFTCPPEIRGTPNHDLEVSCSVSEAEEE